jgi:hypothetical protein
MKLSFLCDAHRQELTINVTKAIRFWQEGFDTAQFFNEQGLWMEAIPHAGCAFEVAEIFITNKEIDCAVAYEWFYASTLLLTNAFISLGYTEEAYEVMALAIDRFDRELSVTNIDQKLVMDYLNKLHWSDSFTSRNIENENASYRSMAMSVH